jgi:hypothetical protein
MQVNGFTIQILKSWVSIEAAGNLVGGFGIFTHHKEQRFFSALLPFFSRFLPAGITQAQVLIIAKASIIQRAFFQLAHMSDYWHFDNARIHSLA